MHESPSDERTIPDIVLVTAPKDDENPRSHMRNEENVSPDADTSGRRIDDGARIVGLHPPADPSIAHDLPAETINLRLGLLLRKVRLEHGMTMKDVERRTAGTISARVLSAFEHGRRHIPEADLDRLSRLYRVDASNLLLRVQRSPAQLPRVVIDLANLASHPNHKGLKDLVHRVLSQRRDAPTRLLDIRLSDLRLARSTLDIESAIRSLAECGLLAEGSTALRTEEAGPDERVLNRSNPELTTNRRIALTDPGGKLGRRRDWPNFHGNDQGVPEGS
jgi:transcriptional regulator with XRE-family HTH domain